MTKDYIIELVYKSIPYPNQICKLDTSSEEEAIRFTWRNIRFRISFSHNIFVETCANGCLIGSNEAILFGRLLELGHVNG